MKTKYCVKCFKKAKFWSGHIRVDGEMIIAGWCSDKCMKTQGFFGHYVKRMGIISDDE